MKTRVRSSVYKSQTRPPLFYTYLKPGALAKLRYSKIISRARETGAQTLPTLSQLNPSSDSAFSQPHLADSAIDGIPCFEFRVTKFSRCLQRKRLIALSSFFSETQS